MFSHEQCSLLQLHQMPQLTDATAADDNWTGLKDAAARRRRQTRLNVRAYRRRKAQSVEAQKVESASRSASSSQVSCWVESQRLVMNVSPPGSTSIRDARLPLLPMDEEARSALSRVTFPLSSDHLLTLLQYNVLRGCLANRRLVSQVLWPDCPDYDPLPTEFHIFPRLDLSSLHLLPASLHPTTLQMSITHEHWIDLIPHPLLRDNLIRASGRFDPDELWTDTVGGLFEGFPDSHTKQQGVIMWHPPWHFSGWELSKGFARKWAWSLEGCEDLLETTNLWRKQRGENPVVFEVNRCC